MNTVTVSDALKMIGETGLRELQNMQSWISGGTPPPRWEARFAPSIVVRSEAELFGVAMPRFAVRFYPTADRESFINLRRISTLCQQVPELVEREQNLPPGQEHPHLYVRKAKDSPRSVLEKSSCIADCFFKPPVHLKDFNILQAPIGIAYGEKYEDDFEATPYMKHIPLAGGGLCAQAVCFMSTVLLCKYAKQVYGLVEITYLASKGKYRELCISGLTYEEMVNYFQSAGLNSSLQRPGDSFIDRAPVHFFRRALEAYLKSGMPVILPVDAGRLEGKYSGTYPKKLSPDDGYTEEPIYKRNDFVSDSCKEGDTYPHVVLLVGLEKNDEARDHRHDYEPQFLLNDPAALPFMKASAPQLAVAGCYSEDSSKAPTEEVDSQVFLPITPAKVQVSLLPKYDPDTPRGEANAVPLGLGLIEIAEFLQSGIPGFPKIGFRLDQFKHLKLLQAQTIADAIEFAANNNFHQSAKAELVKALPELIARLPRHEKHWVWVQSTKDSIWIWDAEISLPSKHLRPEQYASQGFLRMILRQSESNRQQWEPQFFCEQLPKVTEETNVNNDQEINLQKVNPKVSLITSTCVCGMRTALDALPKQVKHIELYSFMQSDAWLFDPPGTATIKKKTKPELLSILIKLYQERRGQERRETGHLLLMALALSTLDRDVKNELKEHLRATGESGPKTISDLMESLELQTSGYQLGELAQIHATALCPFAIDLIEEIVRAETEEHLAVIGEVIEACVQNNLPENQPPIESIVRRMAKIERSSFRDREIERIATAIDEACEYRGVKISAFATFIPEILSTSTQKAEDAINAFCFLVRLVRRLRTVHCHPVSTIELVGGSLVNGIWPAHDKREKFVISDIYGARILDRNAAIERLLKRVEAVVRRTSIPDSNDVRLALEMEPGPLYCIGDFNHVKLVCQKLELRKKQNANDAMAQVVGLNLDIPHWAFLGTHDVTTHARAITATDAREPLVFRRIIHAHVSDHFTGHFCDDVLLSIHRDRKTFLPWISLLADRQGVDMPLEQKQDFPRYSGFVSNELEACKSPEMVSISVGRSIDELGLHCQNSNSPPPAG